MTALIDATITDIDATITYWRTRGVSPGSIAHDMRGAGLRCQRNRWDSVREAMIALETIRSASGHIDAAEPLRLAA